MTIISNFYYFFIIVAISMFLLLVTVLPDIHVISDIWELLVIFPLVSFIFVPKIYSGKGNNWKDFNLGGFFFYTMALIMVIGTINIFVIKAVYPKYGGNISLTYYYWMGGMISFSLGYIYFKNKIRLNNKKIRPHMVLSYQLIVLVSIISIFGTLCSFYSLDFIPFLEGKGKDLRYMNNVASISLPIRIWSFNVISAIFGFSYLINIGKDRRVLLITLISLISSFFFITRVYAYLIICIFTLILFFKFNKMRSLIIISIMGIMFFSSMNVLFLDYRSRANKNSIENNMHLNKLQSKVVYNLFNEYRQLNLLINEYNKSPKLGITLLGIPIGFIPAPILPEFCTEMAINDDSV